MLMTVIVLSFGTSMCDKTKIMLVPDVFVILSPCAKFPISFPNAVVHTSFVAESLTKD